MGHYRVPVIVAFYHDTASPKASSDCRRFIMSHMGLELLLRVQTPEMASLAPSRPFSQPRRIHEWTSTGDLVRVSVPAEMQHDKTGDKLRKLLGLEHYLMPKARRRMLATNFTKAETREEREQVVKCRRLLEQPLCVENYKERWGLLSPVTCHLSGGGCSCTLRSSSWRRTSTTTTWAPSLSASCPARDSLS